jgi:hypothetical protein
MIAPIKALCAPNAPDASPRIRYDMNEVEKLATEGVAA